MSREHDVFQSIDRLQWARDPIRVAHALKFVQIEDAQETILNFHDTKLTHKAHDAADMYDR